MKTIVPRFWLQETPSFPNAPQREEYETDESFYTDGLKYEREWRALYICGNAKCKDHNCPQHHPAPQKRPRGRG